MRIMKSLAGLILAYSSLVFGEMDSTKSEELEEARDFLRDVKVQPPEEILHWLKSRKILEESPIETYEGEEIASTEIFLTQAIATTLKNQWNIEIAESEVVLRYGEWQASAGPFDPVFTSSLESQWLLDSQQIGFKTDLTGKITNFSVGVEKLARIGTRFSLGTNIQQVFDPALISVSPNFARFNQSTLSFEIDQPLLRRFLYNEESVDEIVSSLQFDAARYTLVQTMAEQVLDTILAYWELVAAAKVVEINQDVQRILDGLTGATYRLVEKEVLAASELNQQIAELARNRRDLIASKQEVYERFNRLLFQMGERKCHFSDQIPELIVDNFVSSVGRSQCWDIDYLLNLAYLHRGDLIAARINIQEADVQYRLARHNILPSLDVVLGVELLNNTVNQDSRPFFSSYYFHDGEKDLSAELRLSVPLWNDRARGERTRRREIRTQAFLEENQLWSGIYSEIATTLREQIELIDEIYYANKAAEWYEIALRDEILRTKEGYGSLFIVIDFENRFRRTLIERVNVQMQYAQNIARLLFLTGTLVMIDMETMQVKVDPISYQHLFKSYEPYCARKY